MHKLFSSFSSKIRCFHYLFHLSQKLTFEKKLFSDLEPWACNNKKDLAVAHSRLKQLISVCQTPDKKAKHSENQPVLFIPKHNYPDKNALNTYYFFCAHSINAQSMQSYLKPATITTQIIRIFHANGYMLSCCCCCFYLLLFGMPKSNTPWLRYGLHVKIACSYDFFLLLLLLLYFVCAGNFEKMSLIVMDIWRNTIRCLSVRT